MQKSVKSIMRTTVNLGTFHALLGVVKKYGRRTSGNIWMKYVYAGILLEYRRMGEEMYYILIYNIRGILLQFDIYSITSVVLSPSQF